MNLINNCICLIKEYNLLNKDGIIVCEYENELVNNDEFKLLKEKSYGSKNVRIYQL